MNQPGEYLKNSSELVNGPRTRENDADSTRPVLNELGPAEMDAPEYRTRTNSPNNWTAIANAERTLADRAYAAIYSAISEGTFRPGDRLRIEDLSASLQISPTPIREALNRLEAVGLAEHVPHRGSRVCMVSESEFRELYELRLMLEPLAVSKAAERFTSEDTIAARGYLDRLNAAVRNNEFPYAWEAHAAFHFSLYRAARSRWLKRVITPLWDSCRRYRDLQNNLRANPPQNQMEHENILKACIAHDPKLASTELYNHMARNANVIAKSTFGEVFFQLKA